MRDSEALVAQAFMFGGSTGQCIAIFEKKTSNSIDLLLSFLLGFFFQSIYSDKVIKNTYKCILHLRIDSTLNVAS